MTAVDDVVLPSFTNVGEPTCTNADSDRAATSSDTNIRVIYSSIPPDVNVDAMPRATKSKAVGEMLRISRKPDGKLSIFASETAERTSPSVYARGQSSVCVVCRRTIADMEMFLNFPDDLDRRRLWGNMLGFKYSDMLRMRDGSAMLSTGLICTDHFSEECYRAFNFNKAAIETLGMPSVSSPGVKLTPSKKWIPWDCTVCSFQSHSVCAMQKHMVEHTDDVLIRYHPKSPRGLLCPFCRKCTYGYKTMGGLRRHLMTPPMQHCQLKRIFEVARDNCRSSLLEPVTKWSSWTDHNVYVAYHGCEPPPRTPRKRPGSALSVGLDSSDDSSSSSPRVLQESPRTTEALSSSELNSSSSNVTPNSTPTSEKLKTPHFTPVNTVSLFVTPVKSTTKPSSVLRYSDRKSPHQNPRRPLIFSSPAKRDVFGMAKLSKKLERPVLQLRKPLLPDDVVEACQINENEKQSHNRYSGRKSDGNSKRSVAEVILKATAAPQNTLLDALNLMSSNGVDDSSTVDPALAKPLLCDDILGLRSVVPPLSAQVLSNKTRRQLESVEARLRLFGDCSRVEVPSGYTTVETKSGVRLVEGDANAYDLSGAICLPRGRFVPVSR